MPASEMPIPHDLIAKPLIEAIFELQWELRSDGFLSIDPGFALFQGRYFDRVRDTFPLAQPLPASGVPEGMTAHTVRQQFRTGKDSWPVTQIGPGILTANETANYRWESFQPLLAKLVNALFESYPVDISPLKPKQATLRYLNVLDLLASKPRPPLLDYLKDKLHTDISPEPLLFPTPDQARSPNGLNLNLFYQLNDPEAIAGINIALGEVNGKPSIIFEIHVQTLPNKSPQNPANLIAWIDDAHAIVDKWFFALVRGSLLEQFEKPDAK